MAGRVPELQQPATPTPEEIAQSIAALEGLQRETPEIGFLEVKRSTILGNLEAK